MIEYIVPGNIDDRILTRAVQTLNNGGLIAHPTDTSWHISCASTSGTGIEKLKKLKKFTRKHKLTMIASEISQIARFAEISTAQYKLIHRLTPGPYVFILESLKKLEKITGVKRPELGVRIPNHPVPIALINALGEPVFSATAARSMDDPNWWDPEMAEENLFEMGWELEDIREIDMILDTGEALSKELTTVLDLTGDDVTVIRQGIGPY